MLDSKPYMTRIFTTISPDEMDRDPIFVNAPGLGDVSNQHVAEGSGICSNNGEGDVITEVKLTLADGTVIDVEGEWSPWDNAPGEEASSVSGKSLSTLDSASEISLLGEEGTLRVIAPDMVEFEDNQIDLTTSGIDNAGENLADSETSTPGGSTPVEPGGDDGTTTPTATLETSVSDDSGGCATGPNNGTLFPLFILLLISLPALRRATEN